LPATADNATRQKQRWLRRVAVPPCPENVRPPRTKSLPKPPRLPATADDGRPVKTAVVEKGRGACRSRDVPAGDNPNSAPNSPTPNVQIEGLAAPNVNGAPEVQKTAGRERTLIGQSLSNAELDWNLIR